MASSKPACIVTQRASGPCQRCGAYATAMHLLVAEAQEDPPALLCAACCPECRKGVR